MNFSYCDASLHKVNDNYYLFDTYSFSIEKIENEHVKYVEKMINNTSDFSLHDLPQSLLKQILICIQNGDFFRKNKIGRINAINNNIPIFSFTPIHRCNFSCTYCFARSGDNYKDEQKILSKDVIKNMLSFIRKNFQNKNKIRLEFVGGGEPLLHFDALKQIINEIRNEKDYQFSINLITNGSLLNDEIIDWIDKNNINLGISIDGDQELHDKQRRLKNNNGSYEEIISNYLKIKNNDSIKFKTRDIWIVSVLTTNCKSIYDILKHHKSIGVNSLEIRIPRGSEDNEILLNEKNLMYFKNLYFKFTQHLMNDISNNRYENILAISNNYDTFGKLIKRLINIEKVIYRCGAGKWKFACAANGDIYPCDSFLDYKNFVLSDVNTSGINKSIQNKFIDSNVQTSSPCDVCSFRYLCGGDCYYNIYLHTNDLLNCNTSFCKLNKYLCQLAINLVYEIKQHQNYYEKLKKTLKTREYMSV